MFASCLRMGWWLLMYTISQRIGAEHCHSTDWGAVPSCDVERKSDEQEFLRELIQTIERFYNYDFRAWTQENVMAL